MTDSEKIAFTMQQRTCEFKETFAEHEARTGRKLIQVSWSEHQVKSKEQHDKLIAAVENSKTQLYAKRVELKGKIQAEKDEEAKAKYKKELDIVNAEYDRTIIPAAFVPKPIPIRLQKVIDKKSK